MRIDILTIHPSLLDSPFSVSMMKRAQSSGHAEIHLHDIRDYTEDKHRRVDDYAYGGEAGMVMRIEPIHRCMQSLKSERDYDDILYMTPDGTRFNQGLANQLSSHENIIILCGHYKGVDQRVRDAYVTREISIGDYVLTGGELAAAVVVDSIVRLIPGVLGDEASALSDSFQDGLLSPPIYTRPEDFNGLRVPEVLLSGNTALIEDWRAEQAISRTEQLRPDLLDKK